MVTDPATPLPQRLASLHGELRALVGELRPEVVVVERVFFQTNARTAMATGQASGLALAVAADSGCTVVQYTANEVKMAVCGYGAATKAQVQQMVTRLLELQQVPKPPDVADALALAICHVTAMPLRRAVAAAVARHPAATAAHRPGALPTSPPAAPAPLVPAHTAPAPLVPARGARARVAPGPLTETQGEAS